MGTYSLASFWYVHRDNNLHVKHLRLLTAVSKRAPGPPGARRTVIENVL